MAKQVDRKLAFYEIGKGSLLREMQELFEEAQAYTQIEGLPASVKLSITVLPGSDEGFGMVRFQVGISKTPKQSKHFTTLIRDGLAIADGDDPADALQLDLDLPMPIPFTPSRRAQ
jgi:hypothetical protein